jgi:uncharacterized protein (DUF1330 family)
MAGFVDFDRAQWAEFKALPRDEVIHMLNLVRLRGTATYADGTMLTGREAYDAYSRESAPLFRRSGGRIAWSGQFEHMLIGPSKEHWHICFIAEYPSPEAFLSLMRNPDYIRATRHRRVAVEDSRLIRLRPGETRAEFG